MFDDTGGNNTPGARPGIRRIAIDPTVSLRLAIVAGITFVVALTGPFGTYASADFGARLVYWAVTIFSSLVVVQAVKHVVTLIAEGANNLQREPVIIVLTTLIFTPILAGWTSYWFNVTPDNRPDTARLGFYVLVICATISLFRYVLPRLVLGRFAPGTVALSATPPAVPSPLLLRRLPDTASRQILRLSVDGHKVQIVTDDGLYEVRMRFRDATEEMAGVEGYCTHRSHWVARAAIARVVRGRSRSELILTNGDRVPVSRKYQPDLEAAGIL